MVEHTAKSFTADTGWASPGTDRSKTGILLSPFLFFLGEQLISYCRQRQDAPTQFLFGFLTSSSTTRLYCGRAPRESVWQFYVLPHMRQSSETTTYVSAGHIILTPTQPVGSGRPQRESNPGPHHQESCALPTKLPRPPLQLKWNPVFVIRGKQLRE